MVEHGKAVWLNMGIGEACFGRCFFLGNITSFPLN